MKPAFWARKAHKWIGLVIGVQALLWMISGLYMTVISIDVIHGDHLAHGATRPLPASASYLTPAQLSAGHPGLTGFRLKHLLERPVYEVKAAGQVMLVDAKTGEPLSPLDEQDARRIAESLYQGEARLVSISLLAKAPQEVASRPVPMWQAKFDDRGGTTLYVSPTTGELLAKRHDLWRWFDFLWMFHIMDYEAREDVNNTLLRFAAAVGFVFALSGAWLLFYSFRRGGKA
ncbi:PepSY domain-containing protein [Aerolutibacter ruishenii]|uniref:PepSY-associated transmembrane protein n=1 Tax=Aerolutibacter ruishenii TaxID=686800 RepID=A0A562LVH6_9GAMM|nr:PepSY domain-containing protein [Lysobacter ruishenii]TWI11518.1 PepSY-associated transmembrane protein [Lysobacter ruishenii]